jgi:hypothetical protein
MPTKRVQYLPTVREVADLPSPSAFEAGTGFYVQENETIYATNGSAWLPAAASGLVGPQGPQGSQGVQGVQGAPGVDAPQFRGLAYRITSGTISFTGVSAGDYINSGLTGTIDTAVGVGTGDPGSGKLGLERTASGSAFCYVVATADVGAGSPKRLGVKIAVNGVPINASECNASVTATAIAKLHSMYLVELNQGDEVTMWFANYTGTSAITVERARMVLFGVR